MIVENVKPSNVRISKSGKQTDFRLGLYTKIIDENHKQQWLSGIMELIQETQSSSLTLQTNVRTIEFRVFSMQDNNGMNADCWRVDFIEDDTTNNAWKYVDIDRVRDIIEHNMPFYRSLIVNRDNHKISNIPCRHKIYMIVFDDKSIYIGRTQQRIQSRLQAHSDLIRYANIQVYHKMREQKWHCKILEFCDSAAQAKQSEHYYLVKAASEGLTLLNQNYKKPNLHPQWPDVPTDNTRLYKCYICQRYLTHDYFNRDSSRSCGLSSKCRGCRCYAKSRFLKGRAWKDAVTEIRLSYTKTGKPPAGYKVYSGKLKSRYGKQGKGSGVAAKRIKNFNRSIDRRNQK